VALEIRSYRSVFDLERRIYRVDRVRLNPGGVPVRGLLYFLGAVVATLLAVRLPLLGAAMDVLPWYLRHLALPALAAALMGVIRIDGRPFHLAAAALLSYGVRPRLHMRARRCTRPGHRWWPGEMVLLPDGSDHRMRRLRYVGPGAVLTRPAHELIERERSGHTLARVLRRDDLEIAELHGERPPAAGKVIVLRAGARLSTRGSGARHRAGAPRGR